MGSSSSSSPPSRRDVLCTIGSAIAAAALTSCSHSSHPSSSAAPDPSGSSAAPPPPPPPSTRPKPGEITLPAGATMPTRKLGHTGATVSILGIGGAHMGSAKTEQEGIRIVREAIDHGVTFLDNCWDYNSGRSQTWMGKALRDGYRDRAFLMTKLDGRSADAATKQLDQSLRALQTDHVDLLQIHEIIRMEDAERFFAPGGAIEAFIAAQRAGKTRFLGFTGHKSPEIHKHTRHGGGARLPLRCGAVAAQRDGSALRQLPEGGAPDPGTRRNRCARHEAARERRHSRRRRRERERVPAIRDEPSDVRGDHRMRLDRRPRRRRSTRRSRSSRCRRSRWTLSLVARRTSRSRASSSRTRPPRASTRRRSTRSGSRRRGSDRVERSSATLLQRRLRPRRGAHGHHSVQPR